MRFVLFAGAVCLLGGACHSQPRAASSVVATRLSVFSDSAMHAKLCEPVKFGEDWRRVCIPRDQAVVVR